jgi:invasion protein IalB
MDHTMFKHVSIIAVAAALALAGPAAAQTADTTTETPAPEAPASEAQTGASQLDLGRPADQPDELPLGERYSAEKFGDWDLACINTEAEQDPCSLLQILTDDNGNPVAEVSLFRLAGNGPAVAGATIIVPLETLLTAQLTIAVDQGAGKRYNYSFCNPIGCIAQIGLTQEDIDAFKRGAKGTVTLVPAPAPDQKVQLDLSLNGFTAGYDKVDVVENN